MAQDRRGNEGDEASRTPAHQRRASFTQTAKAVLWSFFGVRKRANYEQDAQNLNPVHVVLMGLVAAGLFIAILIFIIKFVVLG
jgi:preprotein translocase subunit Sec61beta